MNHYSAQHLAGTDKSSMGVGIRSQESWLWRSLPLLKSKSDRLEED